MSAAEIPQEWVDAAAKALAEAQNPNCSMSWPNPCGVCDCFRAVDPDMRAGYEREHARTVLSAVMPLVRAEFDQLRQRAERAERQEDGDVLGMLQRRREERERLEELTAEVERLRGDRRARHQLTWFDDGTTPARFHQAACSCGEWSACAPCQRCIRRDFDSHVRRVEATA